MDRLASLLVKVDAAKAEWVRRLGLNASLSPAMREKLRALWTYHSNAIEGNTLTLGETIFFLREGLTSEGKPLKDYLEVKNHAEAIDYLDQVVKGDRPLSEGLAKELNALLLKGVEFTVAKTAAGELVEKKAHPGEYKREPNHVLTLSGKIHQYVDPVQVASEMASLFAVYDRDQGARHPLLLAADLHYGLVRIHPFDDGNGRGARLMMNLVLLQKRFPPVVIRVEKRRAYLTALEAADTGNSLPFYEFLGSELLSTLNLFSEEGQ